MSKENEEQRRHEGVECQPDWGIQQLMKVIVDSLQYFTYIQVSSGTEVVLQHS